MGISFTALLPLQIVDPAFRAWHTSWQPVLGFREQSPPDLIERPCLHSQHRLKRFTLHVPAFALDQANCQFPKMSTERKPSPPPSTPDTTPSFGLPHVHTTPSAVTGPVDFSELPGLPRLRYRILEYKLKLSIVVTLLVLESSLLPISLYYGLVLGTTLRHGIVFAIITSFFGIVTGIEFGLRCFKLIFKGDKYRPRGGTRWSFDFTHWTLSCGYTIMTGILIGASIPHNPLVRPLAIPVSLFFIQVGLQLTWSGWMNKTKRPAPFKISSIPKGGRVPPLVFTLVEDIVGVDGAGGREYREALLARYETSPRFRKMIAQQNWFWAVGALVDGIGTMVVIWTVPERVAYGVGACPFIVRPGYFWAQQTDSRGIIRLGEPACVCADLDRHFRLMGAEIAAPGKGAVEGGAFVR
jgi:hypothetical protein